MSILDESDPPRRKTIVEFQTVFDAFDRKWHSKIGVDLKWVSGARTRREYSLEHVVTQIVLAGSNDWFTINVPYEEFMTMWMKARGE